MRSFYSFIALFFFFTFSNHLLGQISITVTGSTNTTPNLAASYASLSDALTDLNAVTAMSGPVVLTCDAGTSETAPVKGFVLGSVSLNPVLSSTNTITINKTGGVVTINAAVGTSNGPSATPDGMFIINGADHVTIDGITFTDGNSTNATVAMEFGIALFKRAAGDGSNNNTIQNCIFNMQRINNSAGSGPLVEGSVGIGMYNSIYTAATTALTPTNGGTLETNGTNSGNKFYGNTCNGGNYGIAMNGFAASSGVGPAPVATTFLGDLGNDIGSVSGNTILNYGGGAATSPSAGIRANNQWSIIISNNIINNNNGSGVNHTTTLRGIYAQAGTSANATITYNTVTIKGGGTTSQVSAIENGIGATPLSNIVDINNNTVSGEYLTATSGGFFGIYSISATPSTLNIQNNSVNGWTYSATGLTGSGSVYPIYTTGSNAMTTINATDNTVNNVSRTGTTGGTTIGVFISGGIGGMMINANNNTVSNMSIDGTGTASTMYGIQVPTGTVVVNGNTIENLSCIKTTGTSILCGIYSLASPTNENYNNNTIRNITHNGTGIVYGIHANTVAGSRTMSGNTIHTLSTGGTTITALSNTTSSPNIFNNKVYNIQSTNAGSPIVSGILVSTLGASGTANIYNNIIGDLLAPNASSSGPTAPTIRGINLTVTTTSTNVNVHFNTVLINASSTGTNFATAALFHTANATSTTAQLTLRNNILINTSTAAGSGFTVAYQRSGTALNNYNAASNNNVFYADVPGPANFIFYDGTNMDQELVDFKSRVSTRESNSVTEFTPFLSLTGSSADYLHVDPAIPTQVESGGVPIAGVTTDFDGDTRDVTTPDIGADEGTFTLADLSPPAIMYTPLTFICSTGDRGLLGVNISDATGVNLGARRPRVYYNKNGGSWFSQPGTLMSGDGFNGTWDFNIVAADMGGLVIGDQVFYYIIAEDIISPANVGAVPGAGLVAGSTISVTTHPSNPYSYFIGGNLSGSYTVGAGGSYLTLTDAVSAYNNNCLTGPVTFNLTDALYDVGSGEVFPIIVNANPDASSVNTLTIKPALGNTALISANITGAAFRINGGDYITIDGSNNGSSSRDMIFENLFNTSAGAVLWVTDEGMTNGATNNIIKNTIIRGFSSSTTWAGIMASGNGTIGGLPVTSNINNTYQNNEVYRCQNGITLVGPATLETGNIISDNEIGNITESEKIGRRGISVLQQQDVVISGNNIFGLTTTAGNNDAAGIGVQGIMSGGNIFNNIISDIKNTSTSGWGCSGILLASSSANSTLTIYNNFIYNVTGDGWTGNWTDNGFGLRVLTGGGYNIYYNTINMGTNQLSGGNTAAINIVSGAGTNLNIRNNIFANNCTTGTRYAIYSGVGAANFVNINYNDYYSTGDLGFLTSARPTLANWQTATGQDANSHNILPVFVSGTDLHLDPANNTGLNDLGTPIAGISEDFDGDSRTATPDMGADEFTPPGCSVAVGGSAVVADEGPFCVSGSTTVSASGYSVGSGTTYLWQSSSDMAFTSPVDIGTPASFYSNLNTGTISSITYFRLKVACANDMSEDISSVTNPVTIENPQPLTTTDGTRCGTGTVDLMATANMGDDLNWYANPTGGVPIGTGSPFTTPTISTTTTYYVAASTGGITESAARPTYSGTDNTSGTQWGLVFDVVSTPITINTVDVFSVGAGGNLTIELRDNAGNLLQTSAVAAYPPGSTGTPVQVAIPVGFNVPVGTGYRLVMGSMSGNLIRNSSLGGFPYTSMSGNVVVTSGYISGTSTTYYWFYNWNVSSGCEGTRTAVTATVTAPPVLTLSSDAESICEGSSTNTINITSDINDYDSYDWSPMTNVSGTPGTGFTFNPTTTTTYTLTASQTSPPLCSNEAEVVVTVNPTPLGNISPSEPININCGDIQILTAGIINTNATVNQYVYSTSTGNALDPMTGATIILTSGNDDTPSAVTPIGFNFVFDGVSYGDFAVSPDGWVKLGVGTVSNQFTNAITSTINIPKLYAYWDDLATGTDGFVKYVVNGTAPNRILVLEWFVTIPRNTSGAANSTFQAWLYEGTNIVEFRYGTMGSATMSSSVGLSGNTPASNFNCVTISTNTNSTTTPDDNNTGQPESGRMYRFELPVVAATNHLWSGPSGTLYQDMAATMPYTGQNLATVYAKPTTSGTNTYMVTVTDANGCEDTESRDVDVIGSCSIGLNLTAYIEGYMDGGSMRPVLLNSGVMGATASQADTITVALHNNSSPYAKAYEFKGVLGTNGTITCSFPAAANGGNYYIVVTGRNILETWSASSMVFAPTNMYDFSTAASQAYGGNMVNVGGIWSFYSGDIDGDPADGNIDLVDYPIWETDYNNFESGYFKTDLNGDGNVDLIDYPIWETNNNNFISVIKP